MFSWEYAPLSKVMVKFINLFQYILYYIFYMLLSTEYEGIVICTEMYILSLPWTMI